MIGPDGGQKIREVVAVGHGEPGAVEEVEDQPAVGRLSEGDVHGRRRLDGHGRVVKQPAGELSQEPPDPRMVAAQEAQGHRPVDRGDPAFPEGGDGGGDLSLSPEIPGRIDGTRRRWPVETETSARPPAR